MPEATAVAASASATWHFRKNCSLHRVLGRGRAYRASTCNKRRARTRYRLQRTGASRAHEYSTPARVFLNCSCGILPVEAVPVALPRPSRCSGSAQRKDISRLHPDQTLGRVGRPWAWFVVKCDRLPLREHDRLSYTGDFLRNGSSVLLIFICRQMVVVFALCMTAANGAGRTVAGKYPSAKLIQHCSLQCSHRDQRAPCHTGGLMELTSRKGLFSRNRSATMTLPGRGVSSTWRPLHKR